jgi:hypothetical protein
MSSIPPEPLRIVLSRPRSVVASSGWCPKDRLVRRSIASKRAGVGQSANLINCPLPEKALTGIREMGNPQLFLLFVIPAQAGIHKFQIVIDSAEKLHDVPRLARSETVCDFLRVHQL